MSYSQVPTIEGETRFFAWLRKDPDSISGEKQFERLHQWRPLSWNPFDLSHDGGAIRDEEESHMLLEVPTENPHDSTTTLRVNLPPETKLKPLLNPGPTWVNLFYDLAWTATFSSLTQNGQFDSTWDAASYAVFFVVVWWLWASQALYDTNFYTNDWFHLAAIFLQLGIFGLLAATTRGFDVTAYILHSPGMPGTLDPIAMADITDPDRFNSEMTARVSLRVIAFSIAMSRVILLIQYFRVLGYAHFTVRSRRGRAYRVPQKLHILPCGLGISTALFLTAWGLTRSEYGTSVSGAKLKYVLWGAGLIVEIISYIRIPRVIQNWLRSNHNKYTLNSGDENLNKPLSSTAPSSSELGNMGVAVQTSDLPIPQSNVTLRSRLEGITTITLGEANGCTQGINGIAGTLYSIISAPGLEGPILVNIVCTGFIVYFLAFLYFEGPTTAHMDPNDKTRRKVYWLLLHLPFLLCIVLLLQGVKNQFLLTSFLSTARTIAADLDHLDKELLVIWAQPGIRSNATIIRRLVNYGISWSQEYDMLLHNMTNGGALPTNTSAPLSNEQKEDLYIWHWRLSLRALMRIHGIFMGQNGVPKHTQARIDDYYQNATAPRQDHYTPEDAFADLNYYQILEEVLEHSVQSARYITAVAGSIFILLGILELAHSVPRDRFQGGAIICRFAMGWAFLFLLLLNIGKRQSLWVNRGQEYEQAGVYLWISSYWVLPTIALAFGIQSLIETASPIHYCLRYTLIRLTDPSMDIGIDKGAKPGAGGLSCSTSWDVVALTTTRR
ncbi:unnamed protein product [Rhizoctonia solani]|uniref:Transmembrane protein n=1 Tax=Rhizoctonia solani TaxID=456999 RepID=A0A8H3HPD3_9AGAM|nr:unnamed protein product [Rhizoctonia solani]